MKNRIKILLVVCVTLFLILILQNKVEARSYYIDNMNIKATVIQNGDLEIEQTLKYTFNGTFNGIYMTIPRDYNNKEKVSSKIADSNYNANGVEIKSVSLLNNNSETNFQKVISASNGQNAVYIQEEEKDLTKIKIFSPATDTSKTFKINYILKNVCVSHNDVGELYYNFIGGEWQCSIKNLNIDIFIPNNEMDLKIWGHGPDNGSSEIIDNKHAKFNVSNVSAGKYVAARVVFSNSAIKTSTKKTNIDAYNLIYENEQQIAKVNDKKKEYTRNIYILAIALMIYWVALLCIYEKDKKIDMIELNEEELFDKYNPMVAGCLQGSRDILARDIIAVVLNLIEKKNIHIEMKGATNKKEKYEYYLSPVKEKETELDETETVIYQWLFDGKTEVELADRLTKMPKDSDASEKFKQLNDLTQTKLNKLGANEKSVPKGIRVFNTLLFLFSTFLCFTHILNQGLEVSSSANAETVISVIAVGIYIFPILMALIYIPIAIIVAVRQKITKLVHKVTGQRVVTTAVTLITISLVIIVFTAIFSNIGNRYIIADEVLLSISLIIMLTDNLMLKNSVNMIEDYSKVNRLKKKIEDYSMMEDRDVEQITLWGKYLAYSVSFGIASKIAKRLQNLFIDDDLIKIVKNDDVSNYIRDDYGYFYRHASVERRFLREYTKTMKDMRSSSGSSSFGGGGGFSGGGGGFSRRRRPWRRRRRLLVKIII